MARIQGMLSHVEHYPEDPQFVVLGFVLRLDCKDCSSPEDLKSLIGKELDISITHE